jgi:hypothetical protein
MGCKKSVTLLISKLTLGLPLSKDTIILPPCADCGGQEFIYRTWDTCPQEFVGSGFDKHRRTVNLIAQKLKTSGKVSAAVSQDIASETAEPSDSRKLEDHDIEFDH